MEELIETLSDSELIKHFISVYNDLNEKERKDSSECEFHLVYKDAYGFEAESGSGTKIVFRPDLGKSYVKKDGKEYLFGDYDVSREIQIRFDVNNENFEDYINTRIVRKLEHIGLYDKLLENNFLTMRNPELYDGRKQIVHDFFDLDKSFLTWLFDNTAIRSSKRFNDAFELMTLVFYNKFGREMAEHFAIKYNKSSINLKVYSDCIVNPFYSLIDSSSIRIDPVRMIDFMLFETYTQGIRTLWIDEYFKYYIYALSTPEAKLSKYPNDYATSYEKYINYYKDECQVFQIVGDYSVKNLDFTNVPKGFPMTSNSLCLIEKDDENVVAVFGKQWARPCRELTGRERSLITRFQKELL